MLQWDFVVRERDRVELGIQKKVGIYSKKQNGGTWMEH